MNNVVFRQHLTREKALADIQHAEKLGMWSALIADTDSDGTSVYLVSIWLERPTDRQLASWTRDARSH